MRIVSWNVNGIRACLRKGFREFVENDLPDVLCIQETKARPEQVDLSWADELGYLLLWNNAEKKGYSGTSIWLRTEYEQSSPDIGIDEFDGEGRVLTATFSEFHLVNVYVPNAKRGLTRLPYRQQWDVAFYDLVQKLNRRKPVIFCGDLNCAHKEIDLANPKPNRRNAGFTDEERAALDRFEASGFVDAFRAFDDRPGQYTWWTNRVNARERNIGWRLDYFWVAEKFWQRIGAATIRGDVFGSDHCPVELLVQS